ncbi:MAG: SAF domain-containing protein [Solirubrobacteraceae bacterium]
MTTRARRRRALLLLSLALAAGGLAASQVRDRVREVEGRVGAPVPVVVAVADLRADTELKSVRARRALAVREVPRRFAPRDALASIDQAVGSTTAVPVAAGSYLTSGQLGGGRGSPERRGGPLRRGERAIEVGVAGGDALEQSGAPGSLVDVLVSTEPREGGGRTFLALQSVELLSLRPGGSDAGGSDGGGAGEGAAAAASAVATLRVTLRQAVYLTAAQNYAREVRLVPRPPGDRRRIGRSAVGGGGL